MNDNKPIPTGALKARVHAFAEQVAENLQFGPGDDLLPLIKLIGGSIEVRDPDLDSDRLPESIVVRGDRDFTIYIPSMTSLERDRFTIAHELGHFLLHYPLFKKRHPGQKMVATRWVDETDKAQQRCEWEANWFAAAFLMGSKAFKSAYAELNGSIPLLALRFKVSQQAAEIRAKNLGLAS